MMLARRRLLQRTLGGNVTSRCLARRECPGPRRLGSGAPAGSHDWTTGGPPAPLMPVAMRALDAHRLAARVGPCDRRRTAARVAHGEGEIREGPTPFPSAFR